MRQLPEGVECHVRAGEGRQYEFYLNMTDRETALSDAQGENLLTGEMLQGRLNLEPYGAAVVMSKL